MSLLHAHMIVWLDPASLGEADWTRKRSIPFPALADHLVDVVQVLSFPSFASPPGAAVRGHRQQWQEGAVIGYCLVILPVCLGRAD